MPSKENNSIEIFTSKTDSSVKIPLVESDIKAGFPSPADDFIHAAIDLNELLIKTPSATFFGRVSGDSMKDLGIHDGDLAIIDKSLPVTNGKIAICYVDGDFTMKKIQLEKDKCLLLPANKNYQPIEVTAENEFLIWGIVTHIIKKF